MRAAWNLNRLAARIINGFWNETSKSQERKVVTTPTILEDYFAQADAPSVESPVGTVMVKVMQKCPQLNVEEARAKAKELLAVSAKGRIYRSPRVLSAAELAERSERLKKAFAKSTVAA